MINQFNEVPKPLFCAIAGATATGKTDVSISLAEILGCEIVCVDAIQVYRGLDIGAAKPTPQEQARVRHHGIDLADPLEHFNAAKFDRLLSPIVEDAWLRQKPLVFCGGTGLYFRALLEGFFDVPDNDPAVREKYEARIKREGSQTLHQELLQADEPAARAIHPNDARRIARALEIIEISGETITGLKQKQTPKPWLANTLFLALDWPKEELEKRIEQRARFMYKNGLIEETRQVMRLGGTEAHTSMQALGYKECLQYLRGKLSLDEAIEATILGTRQYAKRQFTWFRNQCDTHWAPVSQTMPKEDIIKHCLHEWINRDKHIQLKFLV